MKPSEHLTITPPDSHHDHWLKVGVVGWLCCSHHQPRQSSVLYLSYLLSLLHRFDPVLCSSKRAPISSSINLLNTSQWRKNANSIMVKTHRLDIFLSYYVARLANYCDIKTAPLYLSLHLLFRFWLKVCLELYLWLVSLEQTKKSFKLEAGSWTGDVWPIRYYKYVFKTA